jgi:hypothetical protein
MKEDCPINSETARQCVCVRACQRPTESTQLMICNQSIEIHTDTSSQRSCLRFPISAGSFVSRFFAKNNRDRLVQFPMLSGNFATAVHQTIHSTQSTPLNSNAYNKSATNQILFGAYQSYYQRHAVDSAMSSSQSLWVESSVDWIRCSTLPVPRFVRLPMAAQRFGCSSDAEPSGVCRFLVAVH